MPPSPASLEWRPLSPNHTPQVVEIANEIHPDLPESSAMFEERIVLFPAGCLGLFRNDEKNDDMLCGYLISHPIPHHSPPTLDTLLTHIPHDATQYYIHDLAILPAYRGGGMAQRGVQHVLETVAKGYETASLVSVYGTVGFWGKFGFKEPAEEEVNEGLRRKVEGYGEGAKFLERRNG